MKGDVEKRRGITEKGGRGMKMRKEVKAGRWMKGRAGKRRRMKEMSRTGKEAHTDEMALVCGGCVQRCSDDMVVVWYGPDGGKRLEVVGRRSGNGFEEGC